MKKLTILSLIMFAMSSCSNGNSDQLQKEITKLEEINKKLNDSIKKMKYHELISSQLILIPQVYTFKDGKDKIVSGMFRQRNKFPKFNLYYADENFKYNNSDKIDYHLKADNGFEFKMNEKKIKSDELRVVTIFDLDSTKVQLFGITGLPTNDN